MAKERLDEQGSIEKTQPTLLCSRLFREYKTLYCTVLYSTVSYRIIIIEKKKRLFFFIFLQKPALG